MEYREKKSKILDEITPVITGLGFSLVGFSERQRGKELHIDIVIYKKNGVTIDDCTLVHRAVFPRIEILEETRDVYLEVSSPGTSRTIKSVDEFFVFSGKNVKVLMVDDSEWIHGKIQNADNDSLTIKTKEDTVNVTYGDIKKAKLD